MSDRTPEICVNLWAYTAPDTRQVQRIAGRMYVLLGDEDEKLRTLSTLAFTDNSIATWTAVPEHLITVLPDGTEIPGCISIDFLRQEGSIGEVFSPLLQMLEEAIPKQVGFRQDGSLTALRMPVPDEPVYLLTTVWEYPDGTIVPEIPRIGDIAPAVPGVQ